jgi:hypothetical protein
MSSELGLTIWTNVAPCMDFAALCASVYNVTCLRKYWYVIPGFRILLVGLVILTGWFFIFDVVVDAGAAPVYGWEAWTRWVGNRTILAVFQMSFSLNFHRRKR